MKRPKSEIDARRKELATQLRQHRYMPLHEICERFQISEATARRDLRFLEENNEIVRAFGGAMGDYEREFISFRDRENAAAEAKTLIARRALQEIQPGMACLFDAGTSVFYLARELVKNPVPRLKAVTNNLPVAELLANVEELEVYILGGQLIRRQSALLGKHATRLVSTWDFDAAFCGAQGMDSLGLWNTQDEIVNFQRRVQEQSRETYFLIDSSKIGKTAEAFLSSWDEDWNLITNASLETLHKADHDIQNKRHLHAAVSKI
ncbi:MAG: DeoR/GlpR family DNA-binding transcription regulator [Verrucomicrobiota bacterium]